MLSDINNLRSKALQSAQAFIGTTEPLDVLGWGVSGFVFASPDLMTAIKVHHQPEGYEMELKAYRLLLQQRITQICGLTIPKLRGFDDELLLIQMALVSPPYLLDFAGVKFSDPDFSPETRQS